MNTLKKSFIAICFAAFMTLTFIQCDSNGGEVSPKGNVSFEMTDAPIDDANVQGAFVTVAEVKIDGETYSGFSGKQTIDLLAYQEGNSKALGLGELEAGTYSNISLVLDYETDANGNEPGCYISTTDGVKHDLSSSASSTQEIFMNGAVTITEGATSTMVMDFDVRKAIQYDNQGEFKFVSSSEMGSAIRMKNKPMTGNISGNISGNGSNSNKLVVYAYEKGSFDQDTETQGQGQSNIEFKNAVTSAIVNANGEYTLAFLDNSEEYELHCISYEDTDNDGKFEATAIASLEVSGLLNLNLLGLSIDAGATLDLDLTITGFINL